MATHNIIPETTGAASLTVSPQHTKRDERAAAWSMETITSTVRTLPAADHPLAVPCTIYPPAKAEGRTPGLIIHLYGSGGSHTDYNLGRPAYTELRRELKEAGYWVIVPELGPAHWMNERTAATLDAIISTMRLDHEIDARRVHLFGTSMGGGSSLLYARTRPRVLTSVCTVFPMTDFKAWVKEAPRYLSPILQSRNIDARGPGPSLRSMSPRHNVSDFLRIPIYILHGDADEIVPVHHGRDFAKSLENEGGHVVYREIQGAGHEDDIAIGQHAEILKFLLDAESTKKQAP